MNDDAAFELETVQRSHERAFAWCAFALAIACVLPVRTDAGGALWWWQITTVPSSSVALLAHMACVVVLLFAGRGRSLHLIERGGLALLGLSIGVAGVLFDPNARVALVPFVPSTLRLSSGFVVVALIAFGLALRWRHGPGGSTRVDRVSLVSALVGVLFTVFTYAWPHGPGTLAGSIADTIVFAIPGGATPVASMRVRLGLVLVAGVGLLPLLCAVRALVRVFGRRNAAHRSIAWLSFVFPMLLVALGFKAAATFADDILALLALRSSLMLIASIGAGTFALHAILSHLVRPHEAPEGRVLLRDRVLFDALASDRPIAEGTGHLRHDIRTLVERRFETLSRAVAAIVPGSDDGETRALVRARIGGTDDGGLMVLAPSDVPAQLRDSSRPRWDGFVRWFSGRGRAETAIASFMMCALIGAAYMQWAYRSMAPRWAEEANTMDWAHVLYRDHLPDLAIAAQYLETDAKHYERIVERTLKAASSAPRLQAELRSLSDLIRAPGPNRIRIRRSGERINEIARQQGLRYFLDVNIRGTRRSRWDVSWVFYLKTYRIERVREAHDGRHSHAALWVERLDRTNVVETTLGWRKYGQPYAIVVLDVLRRHWRRTLAPSLIGDDVGQPSHYLEHRGLLISELRADLSSSSTTSRAMFERDLQCRSYEETKADCPLAAKAAEQAVVAALAEKVETHEVQHVMDGDEISPPDALRQLMAGYSEDALRDAAAELSAYLAEIGRSRQPRLALVHLLAVASVRQRTAEAHATRIALKMMTDAGSHEDLITLSAPQLKARARVAYARLFGVELLDLTVVEQGSAQPSEPAKVGSSANGG